MSDLLRVPVDGLGAAGDPAGGILTLTEEESRYVARVHRLRAGDRILAFDPVRGIEADGVLVSDRLPVIQVKLSSPREATRRDMPVTILQAIGKGDKPEQAMRDVTVHGAERLVLVRSERSVAKLDGNSRHERLIRVAGQVARQCERSALPELSGPEELGPTLQLFNSGLRLVCAWTEDARPLLERVAGFDWARGHLTILIGPEGGLSNEEVGESIQAGYLPVSLGPYVLRAEVACGAVLATLRSAHFAAQNTR